MRRQKAAGKLPPTGGEVVKPVVWMGSSRKDLSRMPASVKQVFGFAIFPAQRGEAHPDARPMKGFGGSATVMELKEDFMSDTWRAMYTVKLGDGVHVLHCFRKKSTAGTSTPKLEIDVIARRLGDAVRLHAQRTKESGR